MMPWTESWCLVGTWQESNDMYGQFGRNCEYWYLLVSPCTDTLHCMLVVSGGVHCTPVQLCTATHNLYIFVNQHQQLCLLINCWVLNLLWVKCCRYLLRRNNSDLNNMGFIGWFFLLLFLCLVGYFFGGMVLLKMRGASGLEVIPNYLFWMTLPNKLKARHFYLNLRHQI